MNKDICTIFLSYCSKDSEIADLVESTLQTRLGNTIRISRYTRDVGYRDSFKEFMNTISKHDFVLCIVTDSYLKSEACMYEVGETLRNRDYEARLLFFVLGEADVKYYSKTDNPVAAYIYTSEGRISYIKYWENEYEKLTQQINTVKSKDSMIKEINKRRNINKIINFDLPEFMECLSDRRGIPFSECIATSFEKAVTAIDPAAANIFAHCSGYQTLLSSAIKIIVETTGTDYNQIILRAKVTRHDPGLVVFADYIPPHKQRYRITALDGLIGKVFDSGKLINVADTLNENEYFYAVPATRSELVVPICIAGQTVGVINSESERKGHYTLEIEKRLEYISRCLAAQLQKVGYHTRLGVKEIPYVSTYLGR